MSVYEVSFDVSVQRLHGTARYMVNAESEDSAIAVAKRRAVADNIPVAGAGVSVVKVCEGATT